jgi:oligopeptide transport system substrate-binding protein
MKARTTRTSKRLAVAFTAMALTLGACGSDSSDPATTEAPAESVAETPAETTPAETTPAEGTETTAAAATETSAPADAPAAGGDAVFVDLQNFAAGPPDYIDPALTGTLTGAQVSVLIYDSLTNTDTAGKLVPAAASEWSTADEGKTWVFKIKEAKFSNGDPVLPSSFVDGWMRATDPKMASEVAYHSYIIEGFEDWNGGKGAKPTSVVADDAAMTLTVTLKSPFLGFPEIASHPVFSPMPKVAATADNTLETTTNLIGNGPYMLKAAMTKNPGGEVALVRNPEYNGTPGTLAEIQFKISADVAAAYSLFESGQGMSASVPAGRYKEAAEKYGTAGLGTVLGTDYWAFNWEDPVVGGPKNVKLRQAIAKAIDRAQISDQIYEGGRKPTDQLVPAAMPGYSPGLGLGVERDVEGAKALFEEWKAEGNSITEPLRLSYNEGANWDQVSTIMVGNLKEVGIDAKLDPFPADGTYFTKMRKGEGQIVRAGWFADYTLYDNFMYPLLHKASIDGDNLARYSSDKFSSLVDTARTTADNAAAWKTYAEAEKLALSEDTVIMPTVNRANNTVFSDKVGNVKSNPLGFFNYEEFAVAA